MPFPYETCLLKHHVRIHGWLPYCKDRLRIIRASDRSGIKRRLRYFTFCAVGAIDVLLLDVAKVIRPSDGGFDTVVFFDKDAEAVAETKKRIPGAIGFPGDFATLVMLDDPDEDDAVDSIAALEPPADEKNNRVTRERQNLIAQRRNFIQCFPFDVINLDLEEFLFRPRDKLPGRLVNAMDTIFRWQKRRFIPPGRRALHELNGFTLMFTTRIGPPNISETYLEMLRTYLSENLRRDPNLRPVMEKRTGGTSDVSRLQKENFDLFFELAVPKVIAGTLRENDWSIDPTRGMSIFEFQRKPENNEPYRMLHMVMHVNRFDPPAGRRPPGLNHPNIENTYAAAVNRIIADEVISVTYENILDQELQEDLNRVLARRRKYYPGA
jgi:hypothetical protein